MFTDTEHSNPSTLTHPTDSTHKMAAQGKGKRTPITTVPDPYGAFDTSFDPPNFSTDTRVPSNNQNIKHSKKYRIGIGKPIFQVNHAALFYIG